MYNPNKAIRDRVFPVKIGKFSIKYYTYWLTSDVELTSSSIRYFYFFGVFMEFIFRIIFYPFIVLSNALGVPIVLIIIILIGGYFIVRAKKRRISNHQNSLNELKKSDDITKNGVVINATDMTEEYSVKKCPYCQEEINKDAIKCKHCGEGVGKGYEIIADGTYVANKMQGEWTSSQSSESKQSDNLFFRVVWITLTVLVVILLFNTAILTSFFGAIF